MRRLKIAKRKLRRRLKNPFTKPRNSSEEAWLATRHRKEKFFRGLSLAAVLISCAFLAGLIYSIVSRGYLAFVHTQIRVPIELAGEHINAAEPLSSDFRQIVHDGLRSLFLEVVERTDKLALSGLLGKGAYYRLREDIDDNPGLMGKTLDTWVAASSKVDQLMKRRGLASPEAAAEFGLSARQFAFLKKLEDDGRIRRTFNSGFFTRGDSQEPEQAGILGSIIGSMYTIFVCMLLAVPLGVATALYLEEFARKNWLNNLIEININNLAAVPSILYGLLGLFIYIGVMHLPRSSSLVGGLTLALLVLPVIVIATRNALRTVPRAIRFAALALGATPAQVAVHHTLVYALPGIMTGVVLSIARALGETSPLLLIGMVAFVTEMPKAVTDPAASLPVTVYLWSNNPESGFVENTAAAIIVLLVILAIINALAGWMRQRLEIEW